MAVTGIYSEREDSRRERFRCEGPEAHLFRYVSNVANRQYPVVIYPCCVQSVTAVDSAIGKILKDEEKVETYKIEEKGFVVCMVNKVWIVSSMRVLNVVELLLISAKAQSFVKRCPRDACPIYYVDACCPSCTVPYVRPNYR